MADLHLNLIQHALMTMGEADFQEVCDVFLYLDKKLYSLGRTGTVAGKNKTKKGKPDSYFVQQDNSFVFAEATTQDARKRRALLEKLKEDWQGCANPTNTGVPIDRISEIYLCVNSDLPAADTQELIEMGSKAGISTRVVQLNELAVGIRLRFPQIARDQLQLHIDTGQVLTVEEFVREYDKGSTVASLAYTFYGREDELKTLVSAVEQQDVVVLSGKPGVGKSRLALDVMRRYQETHSTYELLCLSTKNAQLLPDLQTQVAEGGDYLILVDDAHRQIDHLRTILGFYKGKKAGHLKLLLTTRNFMKEIVAHELVGYAIAIQDLNGLPAATIWQLCHDEFGIQNSKVLARIIALSMGNARIAVLAARLWETTEDIASLNSAEHLYYAYFSHFTESRLLDETRSLTALALVGFFHRIDLSNVGFMERLATAFGLDRTQLVEEIDRLGNAEIVDVYVNGLVIVADQLLANFALYLAFVKKKVLSFQTLLYIALPEWQTQLREMLTPLIDTIGNEFIFTAIQSDIDEYWRKAKAQQAYALGFLAVFGPYQPDRVLAYIWESIRPMPVVRKADAQYGKRVGSTFLESFVLLLSISFEQLGDEYQRAVELLIEYLTRNPNLIDDALKVLQENLLSSELDSRIRLDRARFLLGQLENRFDRHFVYPDLYNRFAVHLLLHTVVTIAARAGTAEVQAIDTTIAEVRRQIWSFLYKQFPKFAEAITRVVSGYIDRSSDWNIVVETDLPYLTALIADHFQPNNFQHCYLLYRLAGLLEDHGLPLGAIADLRMRLVNPRFLLFQKLLGLPMSRRRRSELWVSDYENMRADQVRRLVKAKDLHAFEEVYDEVMAILGEPILERSEMHSALDIVLTEAYRRNTTQGLRMVQYIRDSGNDQSFWPSSLMQECLTRGSHDIGRLYRVICKGKFRAQHEWLFRFYNGLPAAKVTKRYAEAVLSFFPSTKKVEYYWISGLAKFTSVVNLFFPKLIGRLYDRRKRNRHFVYSLPHDFFAKHREMFQKCNVPAAAVYLQLAEMDEQYDQEGSELCCLLQDTPTLLEDLMRQKLSRDPLKYVSLKDFSGVWELPNGDSYVQSALRAIGKAPGIYSMRDFGQAFFWKLEEGKLLQALYFCLGFVEEFSNDLSQLNQMLRIARKCLSEFYPDLVGHIVQTNDDLELFRGLRLLQDGFSTNSRWDVWADYQVIEYQALLATIGQLPENFRYSGHIAYLQEQIAWKQQVAVQERKQQVLLHSL